MVRRTMIFAAIAALVLCMSFVNAGAAIESLEGTTDNLKGTVVSVDTSLPMNIVTLQSSELGLSAPNNEITLLADDQTLVRVCNANTTLDDIRPGQEVQVSYFRISGLAFADSIIKAC